MIEFNPDGSIKLPPGLLKNKQETENLLKTGRGALIKKEMVNITSPKKCLLHLRLSDTISDNRFVETTYRYFNDNSSVPSRLIKLNDREFDIEIGSHLKRCSDCTNLINGFRDFLKVIEQKGNCSFKGFDFSYEDYFE